MYLTEMHSKSLLSIKMSHGSVHAISKLLTIFIVVQWSRCVVIIRYLLINVFG